MKDGVWFVYWDFWDLELEEVVRDSWQRKGRNNIII